MAATTKRETKTKPCCCTALIGVLVILFAWWQVSWGQIALTVLGAIIILKEAIGKRCSPNTNQSKRC